MYTQRIWRTLQSCMSFIISLSFDKKLYQSTFENLRVATDAVYPKSSHMRH